MNNVSNEKIESFARRARVSAKAGPYLLLVGIFLVGIGIFKQPAEIIAMTAMAIIALLLQSPRQYAWRRQNDFIELSALVTMPVIVALIGYFWFYPQGVLSLWSILQLFGAFAITIGIFHILTKKHTLRLANEIAATTKDNL